MASVHLLSSTGCCIGQALFLSMLQLQRPLKHVAEAQTALFLGVAGAVCTLSSGCILATSTTTECVAYYGSAAVPRLAAAGAVTWSLLLYASSLGCQSWSPSSSDQQQQEEEEPTSAEKEKEESGGVSLGLRGASGLTASAVMASVPWLIHGALVRTCGDAWRLWLCSNVRITTNAAMTTSTITAECGHIDSSLSVSIGLACFSLLLAWVGELMPRVTLRLLCRLVGACIATLSPFAVWSMQPTDPRMATPPSFYIVCAAFSGATCLSSAWGLLWTARATTTTATTTHSNNNNTNGGRGHRNNNNNMTESAGTAPSSASLLLRMKPD